MPPGQHQPIRLQVDGGEPGTWLWFLVPMIAALVGAMLASFVVLRLRWLFWGETFWASLILLALCGNGCVAALYFAHRQLYLLLSGTETIVEISEQPVGLFFY